MSWAVFGVPGLLLWEQLERGATGLENRFAAQEGRADATVTIAGGRRGQQAFADFGVEKDAAAAVCPGIIADLFGLEVNDDFGPHLATFHLVLMETHDSFQHTVHAINTGGVGGQRSRNLCNANALFCQLNYDPL